MNSIVSFRRFEEDQTKKVLGIEVSFTTKISGAEPLVLKIDIGGKKIEVTNKFAGNDYLTGFNINEKSKTNNTIFWLKQDVDSDKQIVLKAADNTTFSFPRSELKELDTRILLYAETELFGANVNVLYDNQAKYLELANKPENPPTIAFEKVDENIQSVMNSLGINTSVAKLKLNAFKFGMNGEFHKEVGISLEGASHDEITRKLNELKTEKLKIDNFKEKVNAILPVAYQSDEVKKLLDKKEGEPVEIINQVVAELNKTKNAYIPAFDVFQLGLIKINRAAFYLRQSQDKLEASELENIINTQIKGNLQALPESK